MSSKARDHGFTLVEVLVVLALVSLLVGSLVLMSSQFGALLRTETRTAERIILQQTLSHITRLIEQVEPVPILTLTEKEPLRSAVFGDEKSIRFVALAKRGAQQKGLRDITIRLDDRNILVQTMMPRRLTQVEEEDVEQMELLDDVSRLTFSYFGKQGEDYEPRWHETWQYVESLPIAISVTASLKTSGQTITEREIATLGR